MTVYVDSMYASRLGQFRGMRMSHMIADTRDELMEMASALGLRASWVQYPNTWKEHFDIARSKRDIALSLGATSISMTQCAGMVKWRRENGYLPKPDEITNGRIEEEYVI